LTAPSRARVVRDALAIGLAVGAYGLGFGAAAVTAGLSVLQACVLSLLVFSGASQFALIGVLGSGGSALAGVAGALLIGSRNTLYGVRLASLLRVDWPKRFVAAQLTVDETTAMATAAGPELRGPAFWVTAAFVYAAWNLATLLGAAGAGVVNTKSLGLDAAVGAAFLALLAPQVRNLTGLRVAALGALLAVAAIPFTPAGVPILLAGLAVLPAVARR
jgi:branched chain amino acid efflux pump